MVKFTCLEKSKVQNELNGTLEENILSAIKENPKVIQAQIAGKVDCSERTVKRIMKEMVGKNIIERVGGRKMGKWVKIT